MPEGDSRPLVRNGPPPPEDEPAPPEHEAAEPPEDEATDGSRNSASDPAQDDAAPDTVVVQDGVRDPATALRATSPRNRPGEPIRQPNLQPIRPARRGP